MKLRTLSIYIIILFTVNYLFIKPAMAANQGTWDASTFVWYPTSGSGELWLRFPSAVSNIYAYTQPLVCCSMYSFLVSGAANTWIDTGQTVTEGAIISAFGDGPSGTSDWYIGTNPDPTPTPTPASPYPQSTSYGLAQYGFGSGGTTNSNYGAYQLQGIAGELEMASPSSAGYMLWPGLLYTMQPAVPPAPAFINPAPGNNYNILNLTINQGSNLSDTNYAIAVSTDPAFLSNIQYIQSNNTLGAAIFWQSYTAWWATGGASSGTNIIGLNPGITYYARIQANRGTFTQGTYSGVSSAATVNPTFTFLLQTTNQTVPPYTVGIGVVNAGQVTTSWQKITATITTNANRGGTVYINDANAGLKSASSGNHVIATVQNDLSSGGVTEGYGARGVSVSSSVGNMELLSPYNLGGNNVGPINTSKNAIADSTSAPITSGAVNFELKAKAGTSTPPAVDYADTITVVASGSF